MTTARLSLLALLTVTGCVGDASTEGASAALECGGDQVCPDGRACPDDGVCEDPQGGDCVCADDADQELCERWLEWCRNEDHDPDPNDDGSDDCDDGHENGGVCEELREGCERGDEQACGIWERECREDEIPGECRCDCPDGDQDDANCQCDCDPTEADCQELAVRCERGEAEACGRWEQQCGGGDDPGQCPCDCPDADEANCNCDCDSTEGDCGELAARCEQGEAEACGLWEQQCFDGNDPGQCPCDCPDDNQEGADCRCECDPAEGDVCQELAAGCERGNAESCAAWEQQCRADNGEDPAGACAELRDACAGGNQEACAALDRECADANQP